jgi:PAS domain S-box-containing protein
MNSWLVPALLANLIGTAALAAGYFYLYRVYRQRYLGIWSLAWVVYSLRFVVELYQAYNATTAITAMLVELTALVNGLLLLTGAYQITAERAPRLWMLAGMAVGAWILSSVFFNIKPTWVSLPNFIFLGFAFVWTGVIIMRTPNLEGYSKYIAGVAFIVWGIHKFDYPFLRQVAWVAPWGFMLSSVLELVVAFGFMVIYLDQMIAESRRSERVLRESEERYRAVVENQLDLVARSTPDCILLFVNDAYCRTFGSTREEMIGRSFLPVMLEEDRAETRRAFASLGPANPVLMREERARLQDGKIHWLQWQNRAILDESGRLNEVQSVGRDITDRKEAELALQESEERFRKLIENASVAISISRQGRTLYGNPAFQRMFGYTLDELLEIPLSGLVPPPYRQELMERNRRREDGEPAPIEYEMPGIRKDGSEFSFQIHVTTADLADGRVTVGFFTDISERKWAEREIQTRVRQQAAVAELGEAALAGDDFNGLLRTAALQVAWMLAVEYSEVYELGVVGRSLLLKAGSGWEDDLLGRTEVSADATSQAGYALISRKPVIVQDLNADTRFTPSALLRTHGIVSGISVIIERKEQPYGVLSAHSTRERTFTQEDVNFMQAIANILTMAIDRRQAEAELQRQLAELEAVNRVSSALRSAETLSEMLPVLLDETLGILNAEAGAIVLVDRVTGKIIQRYGRGWLAGAIRAQLDVNQGIFATMLATGAAVTFDDLDQYTQIAQEAIRPYLPSGWSGAMVPLHSANEVIGMFGISTPLPRRLTAEEIHLVETLAEIAGSAIHRTQLFEQTRQGLRQMAALYEIDKVISSSLDLGTTLSAIVNQVITQLNVDAADVLLLDPDLQQLTFGAGYGFKAFEMQDRVVKPGEEPAGQAAWGRCMVTVQEPALLEEYPVLGAMARAEGFVFCCAIPLVSKGQVVGVLEALSRTPVHMHDEWVSYLETLGGQAAIAIDNLGLFERVQRSNTELLLAYNETIEGWSRAMDLRDKETEGHTRRVTELTLRLAKAMRVPDEEIAHIRRGALLHDIGKMGVPDNILQKPDQLTAEEWSVMRMHPRLAFDMLAPVKYLRSALDIPYCHHEKWDGSGYPRGLVGEQIPLAARIFAVVDVWDALRSNRPYRPAWPEEKTRAYIESLAGTHFDPRVVSEFLRLLG